jgi:hypothetical protein
LRSYGPRDRNGLPESLRFWNTHIEETDAEATFAVGLLYGPSGCGKSSLVKAGLLPRLADHVIAVYLEAADEGTETRLLNGLRKRCPALADNLSLKDTLAAVRRGQGIPAGTKMLLVLDQFEQWLHARREKQDSELVQALRQCEGGRVQCLVLVRDDFWLAVSRFVRELEVDLVPGRNIAIARVEERVVLETDEDPHGVYPDVKSTERLGPGFASGAVAGQAAVIEPVIVESRGEPATETFLNILEAGPGQRLITVIEVLSLANKLAREGQRQYRRKQRELADAGVSLVEIDLLRLGRCVLTVPASLVPPRVRTTYQVCVRRGWLPKRFEVYPVPLRSPLPALRIPLRKKDEDVRLDLQAVLEQAYRKGRYHLTINYTEPPDPPLTGDDAKWARTLVKAARKNKPS